MPPPSSPARDAAGAMENSDPPAPLSPSSASPYTLHPWDSSAHRDAPLEYDTLFERTPLPGDENHADPAASLRIINENPSRVWGSLRSPGLRRLVSGGFLNRMNEILARILSQHARSDQPGLEADSMPVQIRNLSAPLHSSAIPDFSLNMNLDFDSESDPYTEVYERPGLVRLVSPELLSMSQDDDDEEYDGEDYNEEDDDDDDDLEDDDDDDETFAPSLETAESSWPLEPARVAFLDTVNVAQRLLLSLARQNTTNRNTLIDLLVPPRRSTQNSGFPLLRQNAIRVKPRPSVEPGCEHRASVLREQFREIISVMKEHDPSFGKCPLFSNHQLCLCNNKFFPGWSLSRRHKRAGFVQMMDSVLLLRRNMKLWPERRRHSSSQADNSSKRKSRSDYFISKKKRKTALSSSAKEAAHIYSGKHGETIQMSQLSQLDKYRILDGLPSSYLNSGSLFKFEIPNWQSQKRPTLDMILAHVDHSNKTLHGHFGFSDDATKDFRTFVEFLSFLCVGPRYIRQYSRAGRILQLKLELLSQAYFSHKSFREGYEDSSKSTKNDFRILFAGDSVDFNKNDLRFLRCSPSEDDLVSNRTRNERVALELNEWLRIRPFHNYREAFFMNYVHFAEKSLSNFDKLPKDQRESCLELCQTLRDLAFILSKDFQSFNQANVSILKQASGDIPSQTGLFSGPRHKISAFSSAWGTKQYEKLCEYVTCRDTCLLNLQLNYSLFTIRVDLSATIDMAFSQMMDLVPPEHRKPALVKHYAALMKESLPMEVKETVLLCSVNRKTGGLEMQNTRLYLDYQFDTLSYLKPTESLDLGSSGNGSMVDRLIGERHPYYLCPYSRRRRDAESPHLIEHDTVMYGSCKRGSAGPINNESGKYSFV